MGIFPQFPLISGVPNTLPQGLPGQTLQSHVFWPRPRAPGSSLEDWAARSCPRRARRPGLLRSRDRDAPAHLPRSRASHAPADARHPGAAFPTRALCPRPQLRFPFRRPTARTGSNLPAAPETATSQSGHRRPARASAAAPPLHARPMAGGRVTWPRRDTPGGAAPELGARMPTRRSARALCRRPTPPGRVVVGLRRSNLASGAL